MRPASRNTHPVGDVARERHLVRRHHDRHAVVGERAHEVEHVADELGVQRRGDLVEQQQLGRGRDRPRDRDALLLTAGEPVGVVAGLGGEADAVEQGAWPRHPLSLLEYLCT